MRAGFADLGRQSLVSADKRSMLTSTKSFLDSMWSLWSRGCILTENTSSSRFSTGPYHQDHLTVLGGILDSGGWAATYIRQTWTQWTSLSGVFSRWKSGDASCQSGCPTQVHRRRMGQASSGRHLQELPLILLPLGSCCSEKWRLHWMNGPTTPQHTLTSSFQG